MEQPIEPVRWVGAASDGVLELLDQRLLPAQEHYLCFSSSEAVAEAITDMVVRGAPAIGTTAGYGTVLAARAALEAAEALPEFERRLQHLADSRPTAVNLRWAIERIRGLVASAGALDPEALLREAHAIRDEDLAANHAMGEHGARLIGDGARVLTYCNTGSLATAGWGTALGIVRTLHAQRRLTRCYACETRPYLQGARLTMWELQRDGIPATLITDNMAGALMRAGDIDAVVVGADRIVLNGDTANKIGTYTMAVLAQHHGIPFYVAAPRTTLDLSLADGASIPIEERAAREVTEVRGVAIAPTGISVRHPAFDVTPGELITAIVTEVGVAQAPYDRTLPALG